MLAISAVCLHNVLLLYTISYCKSSGFFFVVVIIFFPCVICMMLKIMSAHILRLLCCFLSSLVGFTLLVGHKINMLRNSLLFFSMSMSLCYWNTWLEESSMVRLCWEAAVRDWNRFIIETALHYYIEISALYPDRLTYNST